MQVKMILRLASDNKINLGNADRLLLAHVIASLLCDHKKNTVWPSPDSWRRVRKSNCKTLSLVNILDFITGSIHDSICLYLFTFRNCKHEPDAKKHCRLSRCRFHLIHLRENPYIATD